MPMYGNELQKISLQMALFMQLKPDRSNQKRDGRKFKIKMRSKLQYQEKEISNNEKRLAAIIENSIESIITINTRGTILSANKATEKTFGYNQDELLGNNISMLMPEPYCNEHDNYLRTYLETNNPKIIGTGRELTAKRKDESTFPIWLSVSEFVLESQKIFTGVIMDITERKRGEAELQKAKEEAESANRAKSIFLANMSHEIRTPMNAVIGFSDLLSSLITDKKQKSYLESIQVAGRNLLRLINDILDLSKIEAGKLEIQYESVNPHMIFNEIKQIFEMKMKEKGLEFIIEVDEDIPMALMLDETRLRQILFNLVGNSVKFTDKGYIKVLAKRLLNEKDDCNIGMVISIEDTGIGIPKNQLQSIFESFKQQDGQSTRKYGGTGLGLAITRRLIEMMNGTIHVSSTKGKGSVFEMIFQNLEISKVESTSVLTDLSFNVTKIIFEPARVLVVDDIESNRKLIKETLPFSGLDVFEAENGQQGVLTAEKLSPDVILMDIRMPIMDGYEATKELKSNPKTKHIPIIALTASVSEEEARKITQFGFDAYLFKPVNMKELFNELFRHLKYSEKDDQKIEKISSEETTVTNDIKDLSELINAIDSEIMPQWKDLQGAMEMDAVENFANNLFELSQNHNCFLIQEYSKKLMDFIEAFDIEQIELSLKDFTAIVDKL
ncbi:two-component hybrid sensor and regulator [Candidatus Magnetomorum sp. HK-1]|nr:two-component hybrid sensor and regulator [Candidatus Magnetomorum sp. HK-1]